MFSFLHLPTLSPVAASGQTIAGGWKAGGRGQEEGGRGQEEGGRGKEEGGRSKVWSHSLILALLTAPPASLLHTLYCTTANHPFLPYFSRGRQASSQRYRPLHSCIKCIPPLLTAHKQMECFCLVSISGVYIQFAERRTNLYLTPYLNRLDVIQRLHLFIVRCPSKHNSQEHCDLETEPSLEHLFATTQI